jgi:hypothetical protein
MKLKKPVGSRVSFFASSCLLQTPIELVAKGQVSQVAGQGHSFQTLVEGKAKGQTLKA